MHHIELQIKSDTSPEIAVNRKHAVLTQGGSHPNVDLLRVEIASLRATKDYLHEQKRELTAKINEVFLSDLLPITDQLYFPCSLSQLLIKFGQLRIFHEQYTFF